MSETLVKHFVRLADVILANGGRVAFEWPRYATGWHLEPIRRFIARWGLLTAEFDGCAFGLEDSKGQPHLKPWRIIMSFPRLAHAFSQRRCTHQKGFKHSNVEGSKTGPSAAYPPAMCECVMTSWYPDRVHGHVPSMPCVQAGSSATAIEGERKEDQGCHRRRNCMFC